VRTRFLLPLLLAGVCSAQKWELGGGAGYGSYHNGTIFSPGGTATAGIRNRFAASVVLGEDMYRHWGGELRYTYQDGDPFLSTGGRKANIEGHSHAFHYDLLAHLRSPDERIRPYLAAGGGVKEFIANGPENPAQALSTIGLLTQTSEIKPLFTVGFGAKLRLRRAVIRADFRDYITPFPKKVIAPARFGNARGILHQFTPLLGVSFIFW
jgi:hypothetical protein